MKVLYEFAITPEVFDVSVVGGNPTLGRVLVELLRGLCDNGMVANLNKDRWIRHVKDDRVQRLVPDLKDKVVACLNTLQDRHRLVRHPRRVVGDPATDTEWLDLALESHGRIPFHGIVLSQNLLATCGQNNPDFMELSGSLDATQWQNRRRSLPVTKAETNYRTVLAPLLRHAKALDLVDPYMSCRNSRFFDTVRICTELLGQRGHEVLPARVHIHAGDPQRDREYQESVIDRLSAWEQQLRPIKGLHRFKVFLWGKKPGGEDFHDRHILTNQCGISVPGGLDCRNPSHSAPNTTTWNLVDEEDRRRLLQSVNPPTNLYQLLGEREVA